MGDKLRCKTLRLSIDSSRGIITVVIVIVILFSYPHEIFHAADILSYFDRRQARYQVLQRYAILYDL